MLKLPSITVYLTFLALQANSQSTTIGLLPDSLNEISGLALSSQKRAFTYVHNDSGDKSRFFAIDSNAQLVTTIYFEGAENNGNVRDCEDIAAGKSNKGEERYLYLGDIGNNFGLRPFVCVYRIAEKTSIQASGKQR